MSQNLKELVKKNKKYIKEDLNLNELMDKFLLMEQQKSHNYHSAFFHPSLISKGVECQVWWWYFLKNYTNLPDAWSDESLTAMTNGTAIHNEWQHILYRMGILEGVWECVSCGHKFWALSPKDNCANCGKKFKDWSYLRFKEVPIHTEFIKGHADGIINNDGARFLLELKSIKNVDRPNATYGFEKLVAKPLDEHFIQAQLYLHAWDDIVKKVSEGWESVDNPVFLGAKIIGSLDNGLIDYIAKNSSQKKSFSITRDTNSIKFLLDEMQIIWKAYTDDKMDSLKGIDEGSKGKCKSCTYRSVCSWR